MNRENMLECQLCHAQTDSMKLYKLWDFTFFIQLFSWKFVPIIGCPNCIRKRLFVMTLKEIYKANLMFPLYLIYAIVMFIVSFTPGHSKALVE